MQHNLQTSSALGAMRQGVKNDEEKTSRLIMRSFKQQVNKNMLDIGSEDKKGSKLGVLDGRSGLIKIWKNQNKTVDELESVTTAENITDRLTYGGKGAFTADESEKTTGPTWRGAIENDQEKKMILLPNGEVVPALKFGNKERGIMYLFKTPKN
jgi:hypothetical protein